MKQLTRWENVPEDILDYEAFVYEVTNLISGKKYIGYKSIYHLRNKGAIKYESNWRVYKTSSSHVKEDIKKHGEDNFTFQILSLHKTRQEAQVKEMRLQEESEVLTKTLKCGDRAFYNNRINGGAFVDILVDKEAYLDKCKNISKRLKYLYSNGSIEHGMKGKVHPNKGKKLPQTGHSKNIGNYWYTNGEVNIRSRDGGVPEGYVRGYTYAEWRRKTPKEPKTKPPYDQRKAHQDKYYVAPKLCNQCGSIISYEKRYNKHCSNVCASKSTSSKKTGRGNHSSKFKYITPLGEFYSMKELGKAHNMTPEGVLWRCKSNKEEYKHYIQQTY